MKYSIREDRGCGVSYSIFNSTRQGCVEWLGENTIEHPLCREINIHREGYVNGNGEFFTYTIEEVED